MRRRTILGAALLASGAALVEAMKDRFGVAAAAAPVAAATNDPGWICAPGTIEAASGEIELGSQVTGVLRDVPVVEGERVLRGQTIAVVENADFTARLHEAEAAIHVRQAALDRLVNGSRAEERRAAEAAVTEAQAVLENARTELARRKALFDEGLTSRSDFERAQSDYDVAEARTAQAREHSSLVEAPARADELAQAQADLDLARAQRVEAQALLDKTSVRAPFDGVVLRRFRQAGETVSDKGDTPIVSFGDNSRLRVRVYVDETDVANLRAGSEAYFTAQAFGDRKFWGHIVEIGQRLGKKKIETGQPGEKADSNVLETLAELDGQPSLPAGLRVDAHLRARRD